MQPLNPYSRFTDPFLAPGVVVHTPSQPHIDTLSIEAAHEIAASQTPAFTRPVIVKNIAELPNETIIVYRGSPTGLAKGPNVNMPMLNFEIDDSTQHSRIFANCTSTYPEASPYNPIADRYEVRLFRDGWILTLADGCGLQLSSRLAPAAAMKGFWDHLSMRLQQDSEAFDVQKLAHYLQEAIEAAHFNIYWDAYLRNGESGYIAYKNQLIDELRTLQGCTETDPALKLKAQQEITNNLNHIINALKGDRLSQKRLVETNLENRFFENFAGATTFFCSALIKTGSSNDHPYYLLSVSLGDCKGFIFRDGHLVEVTKDTREDISNARDPGGKIGLCTPFPLMIDNRNLQYSLTPCQNDDVLFFMTDGVLDNLDPERLGLEPKGSNSSDRILQKIKDAAKLNEAQLKELQNLLNFDADNWKQVELQTANKVKAQFACLLMEKIIQNADTTAEANEAITYYCKQITSDYREERPHIFNLFETESTPIGKPDHTTCIAIEVSSRPSV